MGLAYLCSLISDNSPRSSTPVTQSSFCHRKHMLLPWSRDTCGSLPLDPLPHSPLQAAGHLRLHVSDFSTVSVWLFSTEFPSAGVPTLICTDTFIPKGLAGGGSQPRHIHPQHYIPHKYVKVHPKQWKAPEKAMTCLMSGREGRSLRGDTILTEFRRAGFARQRKGAREHVLWHMGTKNTEFRKRQDSAVVVTWTVG